MYLTLFSFSSALYNIPSLEKDVQFIYVSEACPLTWTLEKKGKNKETHKTD
jgi:hypothetical protein